MTASTAFPRNSRKVLNFHAFRIKKSGIFPGCFVPAVPLLLRRQPRDPGQAAHRAEPGGNFAILKGEKNRESTVVINLFYRDFPAALQEGSEARARGRGPAGGGSGRFGKKVFWRKYIGNSTKKKTHFRPTQRPRRSSGRQPGRRG